jgi:RHS repeat-associated protein
MKSLFVCVSMIVCLITRASSAIPVRIQLTGGVQGSTQNTFFFRGQLFDEQGSAVTPELYMKNRLDGSTCSIDESHSSYEATRDLLMGKKYILHLWGRPCPPSGTFGSGGSGVTFWDINNSLRGLMFEFQETTQLGVPVSNFRENIAGVKIYGPGPDVNKWYQLQLKPKRIRFSTESLLPDGKSQARAKLSFICAKTWTLPDANSWFKGNPTWSIIGNSLGCTIDPSSGWIRAGTEAGEITVKAADANAPTLRWVTGSLRIGCSDCAESSCNPGHGSVSSSRYALTVNMGIFPFDNSFMGSIRLPLSTPSESLTSRSSLLYDQQLYDFGSPVAEIFREIIRDAVGLRQLLVPQCFVDIVTDSQLPQYEIRVYLPQNAGIKDANGLYSPIGDPYKLWRVKREAADNTELTITEVSVGTSRVNRFLWTSGAWTLNRNEAGLERVTSQTLTPGAGEIARRADTTEVSDASSGIIVSRLTKTYATLSLSQGTQNIVRENVLIEERLDGRNADGSSANPDAVTTYFYASTASADGHEKLQRMQRSDGAWEHYEYDSADRVSSAYSPWLDSSPPPDSSVPPSSGPHTKTTYDYARLDPSADVADDLSTARKIEHYVKASAEAELQLISRDFTVLASDTTRYPALDVRKDTRGKGPSVVTWNDPGNPVTITTTFTNGAYKGRVERVDRPDGTRNLFGYSTTTDGFTLETSSVGAAGTIDAGTPAVTEGRKTTISRDANGTLKTTEVVDVLSGKTVLRDIWSGTPDSQGRYPVLTHIDGTTETYSYDCCNTTQVIDRDGTTTVYTPDNLGRIWQTRVYYGSTTSPGITNENTLDAAGNITKTVRIGTDSTTIEIVPIREYDRAGRLIREKNALLGETTIAEGTTAAGGRKVTTIYPDQGTRIEEYYRDGRLAKAYGTAVQPMQYEYGITSSGETFIKEIKLDANFAVTGEWTATYSDFLGREYKTVYADATPADDTDNPYSQKFYKENGQLWKEADADGVLTVYIYNARGEIEYTLLGLKDDPTTPLTAPPANTGAHRITRVEKFVSQAFTDPFDPTGPTVDTVLTRISEWTTADSGTTVSSETRASLDGLKQWTKTFANEFVRTVVQYTAPDRTVTVTFPDNSSQVTTYSYGRPVSLTRKASGGAAVLQTSSQYNPHGLLWKTIDARNGATVYTYNNGDQVSTITTPAPGNGEAAQTRTTSYDSSGRAIQVTEPDNAVVYTRYYKTGLPKLTWGARTYPSGYEYDAQGRLTKLYTWQTFTSPDPAQTEPAFPANSAATTWQYHPNRGWLQYKRDVSNVGPDYDYTPGGRLRSRTWARNIVGTGTRLKAMYTYDFELDPSTLTRKAGYLAKIDYNDSSVATGEISTPPLTFEYDRRGRTQMIIQGNGASAITTTLAWNQGGPLDSETHSGSFLDGLAVVIDNAFPGSPQSLLRRESLEVKNGGVAIAGTTRTYGYDTASRLESVTSAGYSVQYGYLPNSELVETSTFRQDTQPQPSPRLTTSRTFDFLNRLQSISHAPSATLQPSLARAYAYNRANQRIVRADGDSTSWQYGYDSKGQLTSAKHTWADGEFLPGQQFEYTYDDIGNRLQARVGGDQNGNALRQTTYVRNNLNQYTSRSVPAADRKVDVMGLAFVDNGVATSVTITSGGTSTGPDYRRGEYFWKALAGSGSGPNWQGVTIAAGSPPVNGYVYIPPQNETFGPDADGNLISDARWSYKWDAENRLARMDTQVSAAAAGIPPKRIQFAYDYQGRMIRRQVFSGTLNGSTIDWSSTPDAVAGSDLIFLYDGFQCIAALKTDKTLYQAYIWGLDLSGSSSGAGGVGGLVMFRQATGTTAGTYFPAYDGNGNVIGLVNGDSGAVVARYEYGPFGNLIRVSGEPVALDNPFRFSTKYHDDVGDLVYYCPGRFYSPAIERWLNSDPDDEQGGVNLYGFVNNDPINFIDLFGFVATHIGFVYIIEHPTGTYTGHAALLENRLTPTHSHFDLLRDPRTKVKIAPVFGENVPPNATLKDIKRMLSSIEQDFLKASGGKKAPGVLNKINAATDENQTVWKKTYKTSAGDVEEITLRIAQTTKGGTSVRIQRFAGKGMTLLQIIGAGLLVNEIGKSELVAAQLNLPVTGPNSLESCQKWQAAVSTVYSLSEAQRQNLGGLWFNRGAWHTHPSSERNMLEQEIKREFLHNVWIYNPQTGELRTGGR